MEFETLVAVFVLVLAVSIQQIRLEGCGGGAAYKVIPYQRRQTQVNCTWYTIPCSGEVGTGRICNNNKECVRYIFRSFVAAECGLCLKNSTSAGLTAMTTQPQHGEYIHERPNLLDECDSSPCQNGATCLDYEKRYQCVCTSGFTGTNCENLNECDSSPCQNGATCLDLEDRYECACTSMFTGTNCESIEFNYTTAFIGFTAGVRSTQFKGGADPDKPVLFKDTYINMGDAYDQASSFICPVTGVYYISVNLKKTSTVIASLGWYIGISWQTAMQLVEENDNNDGTTVSGSRLVTCAVGEDFLVRMFGSADNYVYGEPGIPHSTFTIMLLHKNGGDYTHNYNNEFIGSSVAISSVTSSTLETGDQLSFTNVKFNDDHNSYNMTSRYFNCTHGGVYFLSLHLMSYTTYALSAGVVKGATTMIEVENNNEDGESSSDAIINTGIIKCNQDEALTVKATGDGRIYDYAWRSFFSSILLYKQAPNLQEALLYEFTVYKQASQSYDAGDVITFEGTCLNAGNHFDSQLHRYTCPVSGIYYVTINLQRYGAEPLMIDVMKGSETLLRCENTYSGNPGNTMSNSGLVECSAGEHIQVQAYGSGDVNGHGDKAITTFSVMLRHMY